MRKCLNCYDKYLMDNLEQSYKDRIRAEKAAIRAAKARRVRLKRWKLIGTVAIAFVAVLAIAAEVFTNLNILF